MLCFVSYLAGQVQNYLGLDFECTMQHYERMIYFWRERFSTSLMINDPINDRFGDIAL